MPPASCTKRSAAARSQSWPLPPAIAASSSACATRASRSASEWMRGIEHNAGAACNAIRSSMRLGPPTRAPSRPAPAAGPDRDAVARRAAARGRQEQLVGRRREQRGDHRPPVDDQGHRHRPVLAAGDEGARAVDRIDHPDAPRGKPRRIVLAFLRQPAVAGLDQMPVQQIVGCDVGFGDRRIALPLGPLLERPAKEFLRDRAGLVHRRGQPLAIAQKAQTPAMVSPSRRRVGALVP